MLSFLVRLLALFGLVFVLTLGAGGYVAWRLLLAPADLPDAIVLRIELEGALPEHGRGDRFTNVLLGDVPNLRDLIDALDRGRTDERVRGLLMRFGTPRLTFSQSEELRAAVERFRQSGRFAYGFADTFGEFGPAHDSYFLASALERLWLQPVGMVGLTGLSSEVPFVRKALDDWGVVPDFDHRREYKSAGESLTETGFTPAHREMTESLINDLGDQVFAAVSGARGIDRASLRRLVDQGPLLDQEALDARLVDQLGYLDQALKAARERAGPGARVVEVKDYLGAVGGPYEEGTGVALIYAVGELTRGRGGDDAVLGERVVGADSVVAAFNEAIESEAIKAILFRISSPGGSPVASESIRRAVLRAREQGKPVVVSMGDTGASGGYWIAMDANRIIANGTTLTGSIGVLAGKMVVGGLWQRLGIHWGTVAEGRNAGMWSSLARFNDSERGRLNAFLDSHYQAFTGRAAAARALEPARLEEVARGRVWTGRQAVRRGLIDEVGDFALAVVRIREALNLPADAPIDLREFPRPKSTIERALTLIGARMASWLGWGDGVAAWLPAPVVRSLEAVARTAEPGLAHMTETGVIR